MDKTLKPLGRLLCNLNNSLGMFRKDVPPIIIIIIIDVLIT